MSKGGSILNTLGGSRARTRHHTKTHDDLVMTEETELPVHQGAHGETFFSSMSNTHTTSIGSPRTNSGSITFGSTDYGSYFNSGGQKFCSFEKGTTFNSNSSVESAGRLTSGSYKEHFDSSDPALASGKAIITEEATSEPTKTTSSNEAESETSKPSTPIESPTVSSPEPQSPVAPVEVTEPQKTTFDGSDVIRKIDEPLRNRVDVNIPLNEFCSLQKQTDVTLESAERNLEILECIVDAICERLQKLGDDVGDTNNQVTAIEMVNHVQTETGRMIGYGSDMEKAGLDQMRNFFAQGVLSFTTVFMPILMFLWSWISKLIPDKQKKGHGPRRSLGKN